MKINRHMDIGEQGMQTAARDPVCGMTVDRAHAAATHEHAGVTYYFCSAGCRDRFRQAPQTYLEEASSSEPAAAGAT